MERENSRKLKILEVKALKSIPEIYYGNFKAAKRRNLQLFFLKNSSILSPGKKHHDAAFFVKANMG